MRTRHFLPSLLLLSGCALFGDETRLDSSMALAPGAAATLLVRESPPGHLVVRMRGLGPGGVTFEAKTPEGLVVSHGVLTTESLAECQTNAGEVTITFSADGRGGALEYMTFSEHGIEIRTPAPTTAR